MVKGFGFMTWVTVPALACLLAASTAGQARAADIGQLGGHWNFNQDQSDDAQQKVEEAQQNSRGRGAQSGGTYPGGGGTYPGGGGGMPGGMGRVGIGGIGGIGGGGMGRGGSQGGANRGPAISSEEWDRLAENPKYLRIDQRSDQIVITTDTDQAQTFYPDGKKHDDKEPSGRKVSTKADWEGGSLVADTNLGHGEKLTQTFRVSEDGKQLFVTTRFEDSSLQGPLSIRRVYDLEKGAEAK